MSVFAGRWARPRPAMTNLVRAIVIMAFYFLAGPPIGLFIVVIVLFIAAAIEGTPFAELFSEVDGISVSILPLLIYLVGGAYALVTGLLVGVCYLVARTRSIVISLLAPMISFYPAAMLSGPTPSFPPNASDLPFIGLGIASSLLCWAILRLLLRESR